MIGLVLLALPASVILALLTRGRFWKAALAVALVNVAVLAGTIYVSNQPSDGFANLGAVLLGAALSAVLGAVSLGLAAVPKYRRFRSPR